MQKNTRTETHSMNNHTHSYPSCPNQDQVQDHVQNHVQNHVRYHGHGKHNPAVGNALKGSRFFCLGILFIFLAVTLCSCSWFQPKGEKSARELAEEGMEAMENGNHKDAIDAFQKLRDWYPFSQYAILADLKIGDAHYELEEYEEAIFVYGEFENLHPKNEAVPYVIYQIGRCYFDRLDTIDRDQTTAEDAIRVYERLINSYPQSPYAKKAKQHIRVCQKSLASHDYYVGEFYFKSKHYKAALQRFMTVIASYPDLGSHYGAIQYLTRCRSEIEKGAQNQD